MPTPASSPLVMPPQKGTNSSTNVASQLHHRRHPNAKRAMDLEKAPLDQPVSASVCATSSARTRTINSCMLGCALAIIEVQRKVPLTDWIKINTDSAANESLGTAGCGGIFRTYKGFCKRCFSKPLGIVYAFEAELLGIITVVEFAQQFNWEGNHVADRIVARAVRLQDTIWWFNCPDFCLNAIGRDMAGFPCYRSGTVPASRCQPSWMCFNS
ncbi:hypothetical protein TIFTF001_039073 [Ficus carica]|uniref:RNase H type-1 domain-containing protein n=1 Tax=Ficus carica TaxID=3494 RepID=A0AA88JEN8_FICCA|nr:hypothetical protein TIFTF001_039073 [Ficus carica]